jgi:hypothetical protein
MVWFPAMARDFPLLQNVQSGSGAQPTFHPIGARLQQLRHKADKECMELWLHSYLLPLHFTKSLFLTYADCYHITHLFCVSNYSSDFTHFSIIDESKLASNIRTERNKPLYHTVSHETTFQSKEHVKDFTCSYNPLAILMAATNAKLSCKYCIWPVTLYSLCKKCN